MTYPQWTHRYRYTLVNPNKPERHTGSLQAHRELTPDEVEALAKQMNHGRVDHFRLESCSLFETRKAPR